MEKRLVWAALGLLISSIGLNAWTLQVASEARDHAARAEMEAAKGKREAQLATIAASGALGSSSREPLWLADLKRQIAGLDRRGAIAGPDGRAIAGAIDGNTRAVIQGQIDAGDREQRDLQRQLTDRLGRQR